VKSIPVWKAIDENTLIAWQMNGAPLPHWNGAPVRLVVPGWTGTYWMKHLVSVQALSQPLKNFWMASAYRIPKGKFPIVDRFLTQETDANTPITEMVVNSVITGPREGQVVKSGQPVEVKGIAWDNGAGIQSVEVSSDDGKTWQAATLDQDMGRFSFRGLPPRLQGGREGRRGPSSPGPPTARAPRRSRSSSSIRPGTTTTSSPGSTSGSDRCTP
jgi:DMSO/TMAO reductase YedYZ molybdopterin-dependent catalytic subunit